jgi:DNA topoisomerase-1
MARSSARPPASRRAPRARKARPRPIVPAARDAQDAGLRYVSDQSPGIQRRRAGRGFSYRDPAGTPVTDRETLARIRALAIPPAWTDVWICPSERGHLQATGRDARGRKQYRYHRAFRERRDEDKFGRMIQFAAVLPRIRRRVALDLRKEGLPREKVLAAMVRLLELTLIRVGNDEYARLNRSFGLATMRDRHAEVRGEAIRFRFRGKSGRVHDVGLRDRRVAAVVRRCRDLPGQELFQYVDADGAVVDVRSEDVNDYIRAAAGDGRFSAKDFRTWAGTVLAFRALRSVGEVDGVTSARRATTQAVRDTAERLGNTPAVTRQAYVHPAVLDAYLDDGLRRLMLRAADAAPEMAAAPVPAEERAVLTVLRRRLRADAARAR